MVEVEPAARVPSQLAREFGLPEEQVMEMVGLALQSGGRLVCRARKNQAGVSLVRIRRVAEARCAAGLAKEVGVSKGVLCWLEVGRPVSYRLAKRLAAALHVPIGEYFELIVNERKNGVKGNEQDNQ